MEDVKFIQKYNEVVLENFNAVLKQNLLFQAKLAILEEEVFNRRKEQTNTEDLKKEIQKLVGENSRLINEIGVLKNSTSNPDKIRLQNALNDEYKKNAALQAQIEELTKKRKTNKKVENVKTKGKQELKTLNNVNLMIESAGGTF